MWWHFPNLNRQTGFFLNLSVLFCFISLFRFLSSKIIFFFCILYLPVSLSLTLSLSVCFRLSFPSLPSFFPPSPCAFKAKQSDSSRLSVSEEQEERIKYLFITNKQNSIYVAVLCVCVCLCIFSSVCDYQEENSFFFFSLHLYQVIMLFFLHIPFIYIFFSITAALMLLNITDQQTGNPSFCQLLT